MAMIRFSNRGRRRASEINRRVPSLIAIASAILSGFLLLGGCQSIKPPTPPPEIPGFPSDGQSFKPRPVVDIAHVQPFRLEQPFEFTWRRNPTRVRSGLLVVYRVDPQLVVPRNVLEPVLYAGNHTVQRLNHGHESGFVIGIIPEQLDLSVQPSWFGTPALPERIDTEMIASERSRAERAGIPAFPSADIRARTRDPVVAPNLTTLLRNQGADLVLRFSPQEKALADTWRLPATGVR